MLCNTLWITSLKNDLHLNLVRSNNFYWRKTRPVHLFKIGYKRKSSQPFESLYDYLPSSLDTLLFLFFSNTVHMTWRTIQVLSKDHSFRPLFENMKWFCTLVCLNTLLTNKLTNNNENTIILKQKLMIHNFGEKGNLNPIPSRKCQGLKNHRSADRVSNKCDRVYF